LQALQILEHAANLHVQVLRIEGKTSGNTALELDFAFLSWAWIRLWLRKRYTDRKCVRTSEEHCIVCFPQMGHWNKKVHSCISANFQPAQFKEDGSGNIVLFWFYQITWIS
jgi:hypothetical protein